jgi:hypothetical protein
MMRDGPFIPDYPTVLSTISELAFVCGLALSDVFEPESAQKGVVSAVPYAPAHGFTVNTIDEETLNSSAIDEGLRGHGPDWLGRYSHSSDAPVGLELLLSRCWRTARILGVPPRNLLSVVLAHEAAHFVSHIGIGGYGRTTWENFAAATHASKEHVAQIACWGIFTIFDRPELTRVMRKMSEHQSDVYNSWRAFEIDCANVKYNPLQLIARLTLEVAEMSGRKIKTT